MIYPSRVTPPSFLRPENEEVLVRQEAVLLGDRIARALKLRFHLLGRDAGAAWRADGCVEPEIDDRESSARLECILQLTEIALAVLHVMIDVDEDGDDLVTAMKVGARGYVVKGAGASEVVTAVRAVAAGDAYITPKMAGNLLLEIGTVDPAALIDAVIETVRPAADGKGIRLSCDLDPDVHALPADAARLQQIISNLLSNALRYTEREGRVDLRVRREQGSAVLEVADTGVGIAPEDLKHVFTRFWRGEKSRSREISASTPCAIQIAATRASWTIGPRTRGLVRRRARMARRSSVSPISRRPGAAVHAASCVHASVGLLAVSFQIRGFVTTLKNS